MLFHIIKKELLDNITTPKFYITYLICFVLIVIAFITGINDYKSDLKEYNAAESLNSDAVNNATSSSFPQSIDVYKKPAVLSALVRGIEGNLGRVISLGGVTSGKPEFVKPKFTTNPIFSIFGPLDLDFIIRNVLSLFIILFTYDAISGEKERGTLKLIMANKIPRDILILGKSIGGFISIIVPFFVPFLLGIIIFNFYPEISISLEVWGRIALILISYILYLLLFFSMGLFVSSKTNRSSISFLMLLLIWVIFVTIIPKASVMISRQIYSIPSAHEVTYQKKQIQKESNEKFQKNIFSFFKKNPRNEDETPQEYQDRYMKYMQDQLDITNKERDEKFKQIDAEFESKKKYQRYLATNISRISPTSTLRYATMHMAKTGIYSHERLIESIYNYQEPLSKYLRKKLFEASRKRMSNIMGNEEKEEKLDLSDMPKFEYREETLKESFSHVILDFTILLFYSILFYVLAYISFMKYDVR